MKMKQKFSVRRLFGDTWRSITIDILEEETADGRKLGDIIESTETKTDLHAREIVALQAENETMKNEIKQLQLGIKELVNLMRGEK